MNGFTVDESIRRKLAAARTQDEYQRQTERQNSGLLCEHCNSASGHLSACPLINRESAEIMGAIQYLEHND
jgi:hypothetical protein